MGALKIVRCWGALIEKFANSAIFYYSGFILPQTIIVNDVYRYPYHRCYGITSIYRTGYIDIWYRFS